MSRSPSDKRNLVLGRDRPKPLERSHSYLKIWHFHYVFQVFFKLFGRNRKRRNGSMAKMITVYAGIFVILNHGAHTFTREMMSYF